MPEPRKPVLLNKQTLNRKLRVKPEPTRPMRKIRIICNDPDATDSSEDEGITEVKVKRIVREVCFPIGNISQVAKPAESDSSAVQDSNNGEKAPRRKGPFPCPKASPTLFQGNTEAFDSENGANGLPKYGTRFSIRGSGWVSSGSSESVASHTSPLSVLELDSLTSAVNCECEDEKKPSDDAFVETKVVDERKEGDNGLMDEELMALAQIGEELDLDMELRSLGVANDFTSFDDFVNGFDDLPICGFDEDGDQSSALPDFNFDFDIEACNEALSWMDDAPTMMNGVSLNIACP
ncbi:hypothetical protein DH2020_032164 [Rehmannia glutinosa]|uniref:Uncharacterized protein n=1 Tax=Rehmannia glutinosa TaxID=99300 RepID=A0ABR0VJ87_REHGL